MMRDLSLLEQLVCGFDTALRTIFVPRSRTSKRLNPGNVCNESEMSDNERRHVAGLMRVNHAGEVCAQALYQGQALTARLNEVKQQMSLSAEEEIDHLAWCEERLRDLNSQTSILNILWYTGSFVLGAVAGLAGDRFSLGFVAETERQVTAHLQCHLNGLPPQDEKTKIILSKMQEDETHHAEVAMKAGAVELPFFIKWMMNATSMLLTRGSYYI